MIQVKHNKLRIPTGGRLTSWLFTRRGGVEFGATEDKSIWWQGGGFGPGTSGLQVQRPTTRPCLPPKMERNCKNTKKKTKHDVALFHKFLVLKGETRQMDELTPQELNKFHSELLITGLLIFRAVADLRFSSQSAKFREIHKNTRNPAKFARNLTKYLSAQHI